MAATQDGWELIRQGLETLAAEVLPADPFASLRGLNAEKEIEQADKLAKARAQALAGQVQALQELVADLEVESARRLHRFSEMDGARLVGQRSDASFLQQVCGLRDGESVARARLAEWFERLEPSLEALSQRRIGLGHLLEIAQGVEHAVQTVDTTRAPKGHVIRRMQVALLDHAGLSGGGMSPRRLHTQARREAWNLDPTLPDRLLEKHHRNRSASFRFLDGGAGFELRVRGEGAGGALVKEMLEAHSFAPAAGNTEPADRRRHDAFVRGVQTAMLAFTTIRTTRSGQASADAAATDPAATDQAATDQAAAPTPASSHGSSPASSRASSSQSASAVSDSAFSSESASGADIGSIPGSGSGSRPVLAAGTGPAESHGGKGHGGSENDDTASGAPLMLGGGRCQVRMIVPWSALTGEPGAVPPETDWGQLLPPAAARALAKDATVTAIIVDAMTGAPLNAGRARRLFSTRQRVALSAMYRTCQWDGGCDVPLPWTDIDHQTSWWAGGDTDIAEGKPLCHVHNLEAELIRSRDAAADPALRAQATAVRDRLRAILRQSRQQRQTGRKRLTAA